MQETDPITRRRWKKLQACSSPCCMLFKEMPEGASTEDTLKVMEHVATLAHRLRKQRSRSKRKNALAWCPTSKAAFNLDSHAIHVQPDVCNTGLAGARPRFFLLPKCKRNRWNMKSLQHHVKKLAELMRKADALMDRKKAAKLIKKAEERAAKIRKRCRSSEDRQNESDSQNG